MPILALLKLVPLKDWLYCGVIAVLLIAFGWYTHHERGVGAAGIVRANEKAVIAKQESNLKGETHAQADISKAVDAYDSRVSAASAVPSPRLVCQPARDRRPVPDRAAPASESDGPTPASGLLPQAGGPAFDPAPAVIADADEADKLAAELELAQNTIRAYQKQGVVQK